jgi:hypothetical protein
MNRISAVARTLALSAAVCGALPGSTAQAALPGLGSGPPSKTPSQAAAVGYTTETFSTTRFSKSNVDFGITDAAGYQWYFSNFFGAVASSSLATINSNGSITIASLPNVYGNALLSAAHISRAPYYRGVAFGGGGYFEATLSYNAATVNTATGWPAWWTMSLEHLASMASEQWPGQVKGYAHFIEPDIMEADVGLNAKAYGGAIHDWYGLYGSTACPSYCNYVTPWNVVVRTVPASTNFNQYHRYGLLWVPATATKPGSYTYYFDGVKVGPTVFYSKYANQPPIPTARTPWTFGVIDQRHLVLILSTGSSTPMSVESVEVWQASAAGNWRN